jgi:hypothetical protein
MNFLNFPLNFLFSGVIMKVIFANSIEISSSKEVFLITFNFIAPDGDKSSVHVVLTPSGAMTVHSLLGKELEDYIKKHGATKEWTIEEPEEVKVKEKPPYC